jgi:hypothetical protein
MEHQELTTVHSALAEAASEPRQEEAAMGTYTFRVHKDRREKAEMLCKQHGTTLSAYLRKCIETLPRDYQP